MKKKVLISMISAILLVVVSVIFTILVRTVDYRAIGPENSFVGFASLNLYFKNLIGEHLILCTITDWMGFIPVLTAVMFAALGVTQLIKRKSIKKVDSSIISLGICYVILIIVYVAFEIIKVNYRPVLIDGKLEASYPSSHTIMACSVMITSIFAMKTLVRNEMTTGIWTAAAILAVIEIVAGRFLSGAHWATDMIGGLLISSAIVMCYVTMFYIIEGKKNQSEGTAILIDEIDE